MTEFQRSLCRLITYARTRPDAARLELELRIAVSPAVFYEQFSTIITSSSVDRATVVYSGCRSDILELGDRKMRTERCETGECVESTIKTRICQPTDFQTDVGRLRIDLQIEEPSELHVTAVSLTRRKQRVSFRLGSQRWRIDFTRVDTISNGHLLPRTFEIEIELDRAQMCPGTNTEPPERLARQVHAVLVSLGIDVGT